MHIWIWDKSSKDNIDLCEVKNTLLFSPLCSPLENVAQDSLKWLPRIVGGARGLQTRRKGTGLFAPAQKGPEECPVDAWGSWVLFMCSELLAGFPRSCPLRQSSPYWGVIGRAMHKPCTCMEFSFFGRRVLRSGPQAGRTIGRQRLLAAMLLPEGPDLGSSARASYS